MAISETYIKVGMKVLFVDPTTGRKKSREFRSHDWGGLTGATRRASQQVTWLRKEGFIMVRAEWMKVLKVSAA